MEKLHIHRITVVSESQLLSFTVTLPRDLKTITGIVVTDNTAALGGFDPNTNNEKSQRLLNNLHVGRLYLKHRGRSNKFFGIDLIRNDNSMRYGDFDDLEFYQKIEPTLNDFYLHEWPAAGSINDFQGVNVTPKTNVLLGFYKDFLLATMGNKASNYTISIYIKYETNERGTGTCVC